MNRLPAQGVLHIGIVVRDLRASAAHFARLHGIRHWKVVEHGGERLTDMQTRGFRAEQRFRTATGIVQNQTGPVAFRLVQPLGGWTGYHEFLHTRGQGVHHVCTGVLAPADFEALQPWLQEQGVVIAESCTLDRRYRYVTLDTREALGGFQVQLLVTDADPGGIRADEEWDLAHEIAHPGGLVRVDTPRLHFGVVVRDLMARVQDWRRLFALQKADFMLWQTGVPGSLDQPFNMGVPVDHGYFTTILPLAPGLTFEVIQPTYGPSHYKEQFLHPVGEGIHHLYLARFDEEAPCTQARQRAAAAGIAEVMGGGVGGGFAHFYYLDTAPLLGYVTEVTHPGAALAGATLRPVMTADFSQPVAA